MESPDPSLKERAAASSSLGNPARGCCSGQDTAPTGLQITSPRQQPWPGVTLWNEKKKNSPHLQQKGSTPAQSFSILLFMKCCSRKLILKIIQIEILSWQCFFNSNWWNAAWHSPLTINLAPPSRLWIWNKWDSGDWISFGLITNHEDNGFALTELSGKPVCFWASNPCLDLDILTCYIGRGCLCLLNLREESKGGKVWKRESNWCFPWKTCSGCP